MISVSYTHELPYVYGRGRPRPTLRLEIRSIPHPTLAIETQADLDSGTDSTIFRGDLCSVIGLELMRGRETTFQTALVNRESLVARVHRVKLVHELLGEFEMEAAFATEPIGRNLLGLDFFNVVQIGFQDRQSRMCFERQSGSDAGDLSTRVGIELISTRA
jgi:hypothetical protein